MKISKKSFIGLLAAGTLTLGGFVYASSQSHSSSSFGGNLKMAMLGKIASLGISDTQKEQIHTILKSHQPSVKPLMDQYIQAKRDLRDSILKGASTEDEIRIRARKFADLEVELAVQKGYVVHELRPVFTQDQIQKIDDLISQWDERVDSAREKAGQFLGNP